MTTYTVSIVRSIPAAEVQVGDWLLQADPIRHLEPMRVDHVHREPSTSTVCLHGQADSGERLVVVLAADCVRVKRELAADEQAARLRSVGARPVSFRTLVERLTGSARGARS